MTLLSNLYTGGGDVTAAANLTDEGVIVGSGGAKEVKSLAVGGALALPRVNTGGTALEFGTGGQIAFPATAVPSGDANTLDDYEEGTYTLAITCATSGTISLDATRNTLAYTKIGRIVHIQGAIKISSISSPVGTAKISLPFMTGTLLEASDQALGSVAFSNVNYAATGWVGIVPLEATLLASFRGTSDAGAWVSEDSGIFSANDEILLQLTYFI